ncbi:MAG: hypothetical protein AAFZ65_02085 [Planctomycetota bacterium]
MSTGRVGALWLAGIGGLALAANVGADARPGALGMALLGILAVACLPAAPGRSATLDSRSWSGASAWAVGLPTVGAALALDRARGVATEPALVGALVGGLLVWLWIELAARPLRPRVAVGAQVLTLAPPILAVAGGWAGGAAAGADWPLALAGLSPLGWAWRLAAELPAGGLPNPWPVLAASGALLVVARLNASAGRAAGTLAAAVVLVGRAEAAQQLVSVRLELVGPLEEVQVRLDEAGFCRLEMPLIDGERRIVTLPVPASDALARELGQQPRVESTGGEARFLGWGEAWSDPLAAVPVGLRLRSRPEPARTRSRPGPVVWTLLVLSGASVAAFARRRPIAAVALAGVPAVALGLGSGLRHPDPSPIRLLDVDVGHDGRLAALDVRAASGWVDLPPVPVTLEALPAGAVLEVRVGLDGQGRARAVGGRLRVLSSLRLPGGGGSPAAALRERIPDARSVERSVEGDFDPEGAPGLPAWLVGGLPAGRRATFLVGGDGRTFGRVLH